MFFRNLTFFRFPTSLSFEALEAGLAECQLRSVGPMELSTRGFVSPYGRESDQLAAKTERFIWLAIGGEDRILPGGVVNDMLQKKLDEIEQKEGRRPGGRTRKRLKDELITELLPRAFVNTSRTDVIIDLQTGVIAVDSSSKKTAEMCVSEVRRALGSFPALPINAEIAPRSVLTSWVAGEAMPEGLSMEDECELRDALDQGAIVKCQRMELEKNAEIDKHLASGKQVTRLGLTLDDHITFVLGEDLVVRKFKLLDGAVDTLENTEREDMRAELDARFTLMGHEMRRLFAVLESALRLSKADDTLSPEAFVPSGEPAAASPAGDGPDPLYAQAVALVVESGSDSVAGLQRRLKIGYNRASALIEQMQADGALSAPDARGHRTINGARALEISVGHAMTARMREKGFDDVTVTMTVGA